MSKLLLLIPLILAACQAPANLPALSPPAMLAAAAKASQSAQGSSVALRFPEDWKGVWAGKCSNTGPAGQQTYAPVEMRLTILPKGQTGTWQWQIEYKGGATNQVRDYTLKAVDAAKGQWLIDEQNGILLDNFSVTGTLLEEAFSVGNTLIFGRHQLLDAHNLKVELASFSLQQPRNSGSQEYPV